MDGFGIAEPGPHNAISTADTPNLDALFENNPTTQICASGTAVGLPEGQMGNSEVGHLNIGAGRVVYQELTRISQAIDDGSIFENAVLDAAVDSAIASGGAVHLLGLVSDGGVHSHQEHLYALIELAKRRGASKVFVHALLDGRDVPPESGAGFVQALEDVMAEKGVGRVATVMGRYYAMDRDNRWERVAKAWCAIVAGEGLRATSAVQAIRDSYAEGVTDEFVEPVIIEDNGLPVATVEDGDALIFFNFRPDRARQITHAFVDEEFTRFERGLVPEVHFVCLTEYDPTIPAPIAFPKALPCCVLADVLAESGLSQLHIAETEKYAHVTFFLNGGSEPPKLAEERILIPSPKVATYDLQPEMSAFQVADALVMAIETGVADVYIVNFANCDMVGHTGVMDAAVAAVATVDTCVGRVVSAVESRGGSVLITADHGNAERMTADDGSPFTAHTLADVPLWLVTESTFDLQDGGILADVAPTLLDLIGIAAPYEWTGHSLLLY